MDYVIIVNDNGELKTISATEIRDDSIPIYHYIEQIINSRLDARSQREELDRLAAELRG